MRGNLLLIFVIRQLEVEAVRTEPSGKRLYRHDTDWDDYHDLVSIFSNASSLDRTGIKWYTVKQRYPSKRRKLSKTIGEILAHSFASIMPSYAKHVVPVRAYRKKDAADMHTLLDLDVFQAFQDRTRRTILDFAACLPGARQGRAASKAQYFTCDDLPCKNSTADCLQFCLAPNPPAQENNCMKVSGPLPCTDEIAAAYTDMRLFDLLINNADRVAGDIDKRYGWSPNCSNNVFVAPNAPANGDFIYLDNEFYHTSFDCKFERPPKKNVFDDGRCPSNEIMAEFLKYNSSKIVADTLEASWGPFLTELITTSYEYFCLVSYKRKLAARMNWTLPKAELQSVFQKTNVNNISTTIGLRYARIQSQLCNSSCVPVKLRSKHCVMNL